MSAQATKHRTKEERVTACNELIAGVQHHSMAMLDQIVAMDEIIGFFITHLRLRDNQTSR